MDVVCEKNNKVDSCRKITFSVGTFLMAILMSGGYYELFPMELCRCVSVIISLALFACSFITRHIYAKETIEKNRMAFACVTFMLLAVTSIFQETTVKQKGLSLLYYIILIVWAEYADYILIWKNQLFWVGIGTTILPMFDVIYNLLNGINPISIVWQGEYRQRLTGNFTNYNHLASILLASIVSLLVYFLISKSKKKIYSVFGVVALLIDMALIWLTDSKSTWIVIGAFGGAFLLKYILGILSIRKHKVLWRVVVISGVVFLLLTAFIILWMRSETFRNRFIYIKDIRITLKTFFCGNGMLQQAVMNTGNMGERTVIDVAWIMLFYKNGLIGILAIIVIFMRMLWKTREIENKRYRWVFYSVFLSIFAYSISEAFIFNIVNITGMVWWIILGYLSNGKTWEDKRDGTGY